MRPYPEQHVTVIEVLEAIVAMGLARWLASAFSSHLTTPWRGIVFWTTGIVAFLVFFLALVYVIGLLPRPRLPSEAESHDENRRDTS